MEKKEKIVPVYVKIDMRRKLKLRATENDRTITDELNIILNNEFNTKRQ